jgi:hypothetical protein
MFPRADEVIERGTYLGHRVLDDGRDPAGGWYLGFWLQNPPIPLTVARHC